jgi:nanoRNase/pAp phosphatase (c-di-AMP/oligoRNAs hydrolase)
MSAKYDLELSGKNLEQLLQICGRRGRILVLMQNNPDPDAIASAATVRDIVGSKLNKRVTLGYGGVCGRAENRAMLDELRIDARRVTPSDLKRYKTLCLVDTQPRAGNNALFTSRPADIVIDHHMPPKKRLWEADLTDVRTDYGATATILYEYLLCACLKPEPNLATALYYGIESDTIELGRQTSPADLAAFQELVQLADQKKLARIHRAPVPREYFVMLQSGLSNAYLADSAVVTELTNVTNPDMIAEVAELMLRLETARTSVCFGLYERTIFLSVRAADARGNTAERMKRVVNRIGTGGGHRSMAGGQVPVEGDPEGRLALVRERVHEIFAQGEEQEPLVKRQPPLSGKEEAE